MVLDPRALSGHPLFFRQFEQQAMTQVRVVKYSPHVQPRMLKIRFATRRRALAVGQTVK